MLSTMKQRQRPKINVDEGYKSLLSKDNDENLGDTELTTKNVQFQDVPTIEKVVEEGDTLQALSIRYRCPISELKRLNQIHRENEIFAKRIIKVPIRQFSLSLASVHSGSSSPNENPVNRKGIDAEALNTKLNSELLNIPIGGDNAVELNTIIFNSNVKPASKGCDNISEDLINEVNDEVALLPRTIIPAQTDISRLSCNGADADISWIALIVCIVIVIFAIPLIYVFYIAEHPEQYHHDHYS